MKFSGAVVHKHVQASCLINNGSIRVSVTVEIRPHKTLHASHIRKWMNRGKCAVAVVSQNQWRALFRAYHHIEIAVSFNVHGPRAEVWGIDDRTRQFRLCGDIRELLGTVLPPEPHSTRTREYQVGFKIIIKVEGQNALGKRRLIGRASRKSKLCPATQSHFPPIRHDNGRSRFTAEAHRPNPIPSLTSVLIGWRHFQWLQFER